MVPTATRPAGGEREGASGRVKRRIRAPEGPEGYVRRGGPARCNDNPDPVAVDRGVSLNAGSACTAGMGAPDSKAQAEQALPVFHTSATSSPRRSPSFR